MLAHELAADIIDKLSEKKHTVKSLVLSSKYRNIKQLYALVCETLKYRQVLEKIIDSTKLLKRERKLGLKTKTFSIVLLYDFLFGKGLQEAGKWKSSILNHKAALSAELARVKIKAGAVTNQDLIPKEIQEASVALPRYVRVNTIRAGLDWVKKQFVAEGYREVLNPGTDHESFTEAVRNLRPKQFTEDLHVKNVLVFSAGTDLHNFWLHKSGHIILQDKASCFPSYILSPPAGSHVIDCCAAPGNKTSHMVAIMQNKGKIFAFDLDPRRLQTMQKLCGIAGATIIDYKHQDFLTVDTNDGRYADVEYILVDPSCSGSGIASRLNSLTDDEESSSKERLENLATFQKSIVKHALSFPNVKAVTYSTCSVHSEENEEVVRDVLKDFGGKFHLHYVLPNWKHRGVGGDVIGASCIRASPQGDLTNGFFVACFVRTLPGLAVNLSAGNSLDNGANVAGNINPADSEGVAAKSKKKKKKKKKSKVGCVIAENVASQSVDIKSVPSDEASTESTGLSNQGVEDVQGLKWKSSAQDTVGLVITEHHTDKSYKKLVSESSCTEAGTLAGFGNVSLIESCNEGSENMGSKTPKMSSAQDGAGLVVDASMVGKSSEKRKHRRQRAKQRKAALWDGARRVLDATCDKSNEEVTGGESLEEIAESQKGCVGLEMSGGLGITSTEICVAGSDSMRGKKRKSSSQDTAGLVSDARQGGDPNKMIVRNKASCQEAKTTANVGNASSADGREGGSVNIPEKKCKSSVDDDVGQDLGVGQVDKSTEKFSYRAKKQRQRRQRAAQRKAALRDGAMVVQMSNSL